MPNFCVIRWQSARHFNPCLLYTSALLRQLADLADRLHAGCSHFEKQLNKAKTIPDFYEQGVFYRAHIFKGQEDLRKIIDEMETIIPYENWPFPTYYELLFSVH